MAAVTGASQQVLGARRFLGERVRMMQAWADYLDGLRAGNDVVPIRRAG